MVDCLIESMTRDTFRMNSLSSQFGSSGFEVIVHSVTFHGTQEATECLSEFGYDDFCHTIDAKYTAAMVPKNK